MADEAEFFANLIKTLQGLQRIKLYNSPSLEKLASKVILEQLFKVAAQDFNKYLEINNVDKHIVRWRSKRFIQKNLESTSVPLIGQDTFCHVMLQVTPTVKGKIKEPTYWPMNLDQAMQQIKFETRPQMPSLKYLVLESMGKYKFIKAFIKLRHLKPNGIFCFDDDIFRHYFKICKYQVLSLKQTDLGEYVLFDKSKQKECFKNGQWKFEQIVPILRMKIEFYK